MTRLKMPKRKDAVARGAWLEPRPWLRECGAAAGAAAPSGQVAGEDGVLGGDHVHDAQHDDAVVLDLNDRLAA